MSTLYYEPRYRFAWWVKPLFAVLAFNASIGIPCDTNKVGAFVAKHGVLVTLVPAKS